MAFDMDEEILQDFLVEAGEILEQLSEQLVALEQQPEDNELLNSVFRGFHTVKGGAGFLGLTAMVEICHHAEDVFDNLRNGTFPITPVIMDVILRTLDVVNNMFEILNSGQTPTETDDVVMADLQAILDSNGDPAPKGGQPSEPQQTVASGSSIELFDAPAEPDNVPPATDASPEMGGDSDMITDDEFDLLLDQLHGEGKPIGDASADAETSDSGQPALGTAESGGSSDTISEEEFEALLDQLHGENTSSTTKNKTPDSPSEKASDEIADDEFEALLDQLHGKGKHGGGTPESTDSEPGTNTPPVESALTPSAVPPTVTLPEKPAVVAVPPVKPAATPIKKKVASESAADSKGKAKQKVEATVRVDTTVLDNLMNMVGELVLVRNRLTLLKDKREDEEVTKAVANLDLVTADLQLAVMKTRMQPIKKVFGRFPRVVRDLARNLEKDIDLVLEGEETDLDKNLVEVLADPLVHLVRNAVDHGIELPDDRVTAGKSRKGTVILGAEQKGDHIHLYITDDGKGMDPEVLRGIVVSKGLMTQEEADRLTNKECFELIFLPGFSSKVEISDVSGRGVGMDVVKTKITQMNGLVEVDSVLGKGSTISIMVPLTLAIMPTLMVKVGVQAFALPLSSVVEIFSLDLSATSWLDGKLVIMVRGKVIPLYYLSRWLTKGHQDDLEDQNGGHVVVVTNGKQTIGFVVSDLIGQEEVVIKPLGDVLRSAPGMSGATITGEGRIALIMDVPGLVRAYS